MGRQQQDERPLMLWERASFRDAVLGISFSPEPHESSKPCLTEPLIESISLVVAQLAMLQEGTSNTALKLAAGRTHTVCARKSELPIAADACFRSS